MKSYAVIIALLFACKCVQSQASQTWTVPSHSFSQSKGKQVLEEISNYDNLVGRIFGNFSASDLTATRHISFPTLLGKITLINFWFNACAPCHKEFEDLNALFLKYQNIKDFQIFSFTIDNLETARNATEKSKLFFPVYPISSEQCHLLNTGKGFPSNLIIDRSGKIVFGCVGVGDAGANPFNDQIIPKLDSLLVIPNK